MLLIMLKACLNTRLSSPVSVSGCADANHNSAPTLSSVSAATGLVVARVRHAVPGHLITAQERGQLAR